MNKQERFLPGQAHVLWQFAGAASAASRAGGRARCGFAATLSSPMPSNAPLAPTCSSRARGEAAQGALQVLRAVPAGLRGPIRGSAGKAHACRKEKIRGKMVWALRGGNFSVVNTKKQDPSWAPCLAKRNKAHEASTSTPRPGLHCSQS